MSGPKHKKSGLPSGFTLVEILVVVVILGIAGAIIVPQLGTRDDLKAASAARVMMADMIYAQNLAITRQKNHYVKFDTATQTYSVVESDGTTVVTHPVNKTPFTVRLGANGDNGLEDTSLVSAEFKNAGGGGFSLIGFDELGTPMVLNGSNAEAMTTGNAVVSCGTFSLRVDVEPYTGQITVTPN